MNGQTNSFKGVRAVVIDEIHAFAGDDRGWHLLAVLERVSCNVALMLLKKALVAGPVNGTKNYEGNPFWNLGGQPNS